MYEIALILVLVAFICEYVDATFGMGFGTILSPVLLIMGFAPIEFLPVVLFSQFSAGLLCSAFHHRLENVSLSTNEQERSSLFILGSTGLVGVVISTFIVISLPAIFVKIYIGIVVSAMGVLMILNGNRHIPFSERRLAVIGSIAAFNKGISGGGYGPMTVSGQILSDIQPRAAVAITVLVEGIICVMGFLLHFFINGIGNLLLLLTVSLGAALAAPLSAFTTSKLEQNHVRTLVSVSTLTVGILTLSWLFLITGI
jgi:hypothetical protein